jgi:hypothetical protein
MLQVDGIACHQYASPGPASSSVNSGGSTAGELHCDVIMVHVLHCAPLGALCMHCRDVEAVCTYLPGLDSDGKLLMLHVTLLAATQTLAITACICVD